MKIPIWQCAGWSSGKLETGYLLFYVAYNVLYWDAKLVERFALWKKVCALNCKIWYLYCLQEAFPLIWWSHICVKRFIRRVRNDESTSSYDRSKVWIDECLRLQKIFLWKSDRLLLFAINTGICHSMGQQRVWEIILWQMQAVFLLIKVHLTQWRMALSKSRWMVWVPNRIPIDIIPVIINNQSSHFLLR